MHVLVIADGRSPHTAGWVRGLVSLGIRATLLSSHVLDTHRRGRLEALVGPSAVYEPDDGWSRVRPRLAFASPSRRPQRSRMSVRIESATQVPRSGPALRLLTEIELLASGRLTAHLDRLVEALRPDALHALRVQFEGIAATGSRSGLPIALSTWGSDLMLTARTSDRIAQQTSRALHRADLLLSDCRRDAELARSWGLRLDAPRYVVPGNFGVDLGTFPEPDRDLCARLRVEHRPLVVYPRGMSGLLDYHGFMEAAQQLIARGVDASFVGVGLAPTFGRQVIPGRLVCTDTLDPHTMLSIAASSAVTVSPAFSDGIPNSILEGMAGGAIPVCGELASLQDLERHGAVLVWCRTGDPSSIASAIRCGLRLYQGTENQLRNRSVVADHYSTKVAAGCAHDAYERLVKVAVG